jgi:hypothetical protein
MLAKQGYLPKILLKLQDKIPLCVACQFGTAHQRPCHTKGTKSGSIQKPNHDFITIPYMEAETIPPHWSDLLQSSSELASKQAFNLALGSTGLDNTDLQFTDN